MTRGSANIDIVLFAKTGTGEYLDTNKKGLKNAGLTDKHQIAGQTDHELPWGLDNPELADIFQKEDQIVLKRQATSHAWGIYSLDTGPHLSFKLKHPDSTGKRVLGQMVSVPLGAAFQGWPLYLDFEQMCFHVNGARLTRTDLRVLHLFTAGIPRKVIANQFDVTVKAIEKRLAKLRSLLEHEDCRCYNLHGCIQHHGLTGFLLANPDWLGKADVHHYTIRTERRQSARGYPYLRDFPTDIRSKD